MTTDDRAPPSAQEAASLEGIDTASLRQIVDIDSASLQKLVIAIANAQKTLRSQRSRTGLAAAKRRGQKLGRPRAMTETQIALARRMLTNGIPKQAIARTLKISPSTLSAALKPYAPSLPPQKPIAPIGRKPALTETQIALARRLLANGVPRKIIAETLKVSRTTLSIAFKPYAMGPHTQMDRSKAAACATRENQTDDAQPLLANEASTPPLDDAVARKLLDAPPACTLKGVRDRAIMATLHYHNIGREELCRLRVKDLHIREGVMHFCVTDARAKIRFIAVNAEALRRTEDYLMLAGHGDDAEGALFRPLKNNRTGRLDGHLSPGSIAQNVLSKYRRKTGIKGEVRGLDVRSSLRRSYAQPEPAPPTEQQE